MLTIYLFSLHLNHQGNRVGVLILTAEQLAYIFPVFFMCKKRCIPNTRGSQEVRGCLNLCYARLGACIDKILIL